VPDIPGAMDLQCARLESRDPEAYRRAVAGLPPGSQRRCNIFRAYEGAASQAFVDGNMFPNAATARQVEQADSANGLRNTGELGRALFGAGVLDYRFAHPERLTMKVLVVAGGADFQAVAEPQRALAERLPHGRYLVYPGIGHFMWVEDPARFASDVAAFLAEPG
jgi:proline iminopeptidase